MGWSRPTLMDLQIGNADRALAGPTLRNWSTGALDSLPESWKLVRDYVVGKCVDVVKSVSASRNRCRFIKGRVLKSPMMTSQMLLFMPRGLSDTGEQEVSSLGAICPSTLSGPVAGTINTTRAGFSRGKAACSHHGASNKTGRAEDAIPSVTFKYKALISGTF